MSMIYIRNSGVYMKFKSLALIAMTTFALNCYALDPIPTDFKKDIEDAKIEIEASKEENKKIKQLAELTGDESLAKFSDNLETMLETTAKCFSKEDEIKMSICVLEGLEKLANDGNYIAEHALGNTYEEIDSNEKAIQWYEKALNNSALPDFYRPEIEADLKRAKDKM